MNLLVTAVLVTFTETIRPFITNKLSSLATKRGVSQLQSEKDAVKSELESINMKEEFARYARKQREYNKLLQSCQEEAQAKRERDSNIRQAINYITQAIMTMVCLMLFWMNRAQPVIELPEQWMMPFTSLLSWPTQIPGAISFPIWFLICSSTWKLLAKTLSKSTSYTV
ncbi:tail-anchored protein insertion receptor WRB [Cimex lectularius]|uniref:Guided entry of tail-anchored proteins factor 1 n=1 Tax=Cimex lectularius TaxID=79782 RepID=A0A8I6R9Q8_CIMLE|nr:tail-anchored protein insertion receptor WRB [Cimex lectularius]